MRRRRLLLLGMGSALAAAASALAPTTATAQLRDRDHDGGRRGAWHDHGGGYARGGFDGYAERGDPRDGYRDHRAYDRHRCHGGSTGTILGAIAGGLLGNAVSGYGDRTSGTIIGGGAGAIAGSAIGRGC